MWRGQRIFTEVRVIEGKSENMKVEKCGHPILLAFRLHVSDNVSEFEKKTYVDSVPLTFTALLQTIFSYFPNQLRNEPG